MITKAVSYEYPMGGQYAETVATLEDGRVVTIDTQYACVSPHGNHHREAGASHQEFLPQEPVGKPKGQLEMNNMKYDGTNLQAILTAHRAWRFGKDGERANLEYANLRDANLAGANLRDANLAGANLRDANLEYANLRDANLRDANLAGANLEYANLAGANLAGANLAGANLRGANLRDANLAGANLEYANLRDANLAGANLRGIVLTALQAARLSILASGDIIGWKSCADKVLVKLLIPADAKRSNSAGRKCRAEFADILEVIGGDVGYSKIPAGGERLEYRKGQRVTCVQPFDECRWNECSSGIHFYITREEAEND